MCVSINLTDVLSISKRQRMEYRELRSECLKMLASLNDKIIQNGERMLNTPVLDKNSSAADVRYNNSIWDYNTVYKFCEKYVKPLSHTQ